jgi:hypothetical protein
VFAQDWKAAYAQRVMIFRNMRKGRYAMQSLEAHSQNVITFLTFDDEKIISGSDDHTLKVMLVSTMIDDNLCVSRLLYFGVFVP